MRAVPRGAVRGLATLACVVLLSGCGVHPPVSPVIPSEQPAPSAGPPTTLPETIPSPTVAPPTSGEPSTGASVAPGELRPPATPSVRGTPVYGSTLTISQGSWEPSPVVLGYQWLRDGEAIGGATARTYRLTGSDISHRIAVIVTGSRDGYADASRRSSQVGPITPAALKPATPTISGTVKVGHTLTGKVAAWGPGTVALSWQWYREAVPIEDATSATYTLAVADNGHTITVRVTGTRKNHQSARRDSRPTAKVAPGTLKPAPEPVVSGNARVGDQLAADAGDWGPGTVVLAYQWFRNTGKTDLAVPGATKSSHTATAADVGARMRVRVTASRKGYSTVARFSAYSAPVVKGELTAPTPVISGPAILGNQLSVDAGPWGPGQVDLVLQWYRDGSPIVRANGATYLLTAQDVRHTLTVRVTGSRDGYTTRTVESAATPIIRSR